MFVNDVYRSEILRFAGSLLNGPDRDSGRVMEMTAPLLEWAEAAFGPGDLRCRITAMARAHTNDQARLRETPGDQPRRRLTPAEFLAEADVYYGFITAAA